VRYSNVLRIKTYINHCREGLSRPFPLSPAAVDFREVTTFVEMQETMMTGLRLTQEGVAVEGFRRRFGRELMAVFGKEVDELVRLGLLEWVDSNGILRLTRRGRQVGNQVFMRFVD
jgi:coproporphyrinogen III oxidase-like Fe-S oxidoreductase